MVGERSYLFKVGEVSKDMLGQNFPVIDDCVPLEPQEAVSTIDGASKRLLKERGWVYSVSLTLPSILPEREEFLDDYPSS